MVDICKDGEEGKADGSSDKNDKKDDEEEAPLASAGRRLPRRHRNPNVLTSTDSLGSSSDSSDSSSDSSDSS